jgi:hypothetical protein
VFAMIIAIAEEWEEAGESIFDPVKGKDILISREGAGKTTKYTAQIAAKAYPLPADAMSKLHNLDEYVQQESSAQQLRALNSVRAVSGLLEAPAAAGAPALSFSPATLVDEDPYAVATPPKRAAAPAAAPVIVEDVTPKAAAAPVSEGSGDSELDELLANLDK